jgi:hypothetical protein
MQEVGDTTAMVVRGVRVDSPLCSLHKVQLMWIVAVQELARERISRR